MEGRENIFKKFANKLTQNWLTAANIAVSMLVAICFVIGMFVLFAYEPPKKLHEETGTVAEFKQYDSNWTDAYFGTSSYFNVRFQDGTFFEAKGISYNNIDRELFEILRVGEEIKLKYDSNWSRPNRIYAIEYNGVNYLLLDDVLAQYENAHKSSLTAGIIIISVSVAAGGVSLFFVNYKHRKNSLQKR